MNNIVTCDFSIIVGILVSVILAVIMFYLRLRFNTDIKNENDDLNRLDPTGRIRQGISKIPETVLKTHPGYNNVYNMATADKFLEYKMRGELIEKQRIQEAQKKKKLDLDDSNVDDGTMVYVNHDNSRHYSLKCYDDDLVSSYSVSNFSCIDDD